MSTTRLKQILKADALVNDALIRLQSMQRSEAHLPDAWIASGCLYQAVWNALDGRPSGHGVKDVDLIYFNDRDLSYEAEDAAIRAATPFFDGLSAPVEIRNQARVHLWYPERFGAPYPKLESATGSLLYYASRTHAIAARLDGDDVLDIIAPFGLEDIFAQRVTPNTALDNRLTHHAKAERARRYWPGLEITPWPDPHRRTED